MQSALRLARRQALSARSIACRPSVSTRQMATATSGVHVVSHTSTESTSSIPLSNVEAQWEKMSTEEQMQVHSQLEELQKKNWKDLTIDQKKAAYYVAFGPHGPRADINPPGTALRTIAYVLAAVAVSGVISLTIRQYANGPPHTMSKEWQEKSNEIAKEKNLNPISGISSEGYKGSGFVQSK